MTNIFNSSDASFMYRVTASDSDFYCDYSSALEIFHNTPKTLFWLPSPAEKKQRKNLTRDPNKINEQERGEEC